MSAKIVSQLCDEPTEDASAATAGGYPACPNRELPRLPSEAPIADSQDRGPRGIVYGLLVGMAFFGFLAFIALFQGLLCRLLGVEQ